MVVFPTATIYEIKTNAYHKDACKKFMRRKAELNINL